MEKQDGILGLLLVVSIGAARDNRDLMGSRGNRGGHLARSASDSASHVVEQREAKVVMTQPPTLDQFSAQSGVVEIDGGE